MKQKNISSFFLINETSQPKQMKPRKKFSSQNDDIIQIVQFQAFIENNSLTMFFFDNKD